MVGVSLAFAAIAAYAFRALGQPEARRYFAAVSSSGSGQQATPIAAKEGRV